MILHGQLEVGQLRPTSERVCQRMLRGARLLQGRKSMCTKKRVLLPGGVTATVMNAVTTSRITKTMERILYMVYTCPHETREGQLLHRTVYLGPWVWQRMWFDWGDRCAAMLLRWQHMAMGTSHLMAPDGREYVV